MIIPLLATALISITLPTSLTPEQQENFDFLVYFIDRLKLDKKFVEKAKTFVQQPNTELILRSKIDHEFFKYSRNLFCIFNHKFLNNKSFFTFSLAITSDEYEPISYPDFLLEQAEPQNSCKEAYEEYKLNCLSRLDPIIKSLENLHAGTEYSGKSFLLKQAAIGLCDTPQVIADIESYTRNFTDSKIMDPGSWGRTLKLPIQKDNFSTTIVYQMTGYDFGSGIKFQRHTATYRIQININHSFYTHNTYVDRTEFNAQYRILCKKIQSIKHKFDWI